VTPCAFLRVLHGSVFWKLSPQARSPNPRPDATLSGYEVTWARKIGQRDK
jgi:hypothetical protein